MALALLRALLGARSLLPAGAQLLLEVAAIEPVRLDRLLDERFAIWLRAIRTPFAPRY
jgi:hypothetical protein